MTAHCEWCPFPGCDSCAYKGHERGRERRFGRLCDTLGVSTERPQPVSLHLTSRGLAATRPHLEEGGIVVDPTVPETDPNRLVLAWCECCGVLLAKRASDRNRMHFDCWADHHCGPDSPWPPGHQTPTPDEIVRRSIELMITDVTLTEVGDTIRAEPSREKRAETEQEIRYAAQVYASQVTLDATGPSEQEIAEAIHGGIEQLGRIFGEAE